MKKRLSVVLLALVLVVCCFSASACEQISGFVSGLFSGDSGNDEEQVTQYTVTFIMDGVQQEVQVEKGHSIAEDDIPNTAKDYYIFQGWFQDGSNTSFDFTTIIDSNIALNARWKMDPNHKHQYVLASSKPATCTIAQKDTYICSVCKNKDVRTIGEPLGHIFDFSALDENNYLDMVVCSREGCTGAGRRESLDIYEDVFVVNFDDEKLKEISDFYQTILENLSTAEVYDESKHKNTPNGQGEYDHENPYYIANKQGFERTYYDPFYEYIEYVTEQYQYTYVFYCVYEGDKTWETKFDTISDFRTDCIKNFYALYRKIYNTQYREFFFSYEEGWTDEDIEQVLIMSDSYGGDAYAELNKRSDEIVVEFRALKNQGSGMDVPNLYEEFVGINKQIATLSGYDDYMSYAYESVYEREYSPEDVAEMRQYVKQYIVPVFTALYEASKTLKVSSATGKALLNQSLFSSAIATQYVSDYFHQVADSTLGSKPVDYWSTANELFKNGNMYTGKHQGAFSYYIGAQDATILYFGPGSYSGSFTFIHEFGHYYNNIYNPGLYLSMDHDETQSQGDEMLFLAWLQGALKAAGESDAEYTAIMVEKIVDMLSTVLMSSAVDEFEQAVYANTYGEPGNVYYNGITKDKYDSLFRTIMSTYGIGGIYNASYWRYVVIEAPAYYISYAMSALPSIGMYVKVMNDGFDAGMESYLKLYTFSDDEKYVRTDGSGDKVVDATYEQILNYAGLYGPFQEELYQALSNYFQ